MFKFTLFGFPKFLHNNLFEYKNYEINQRTNAAIEFLIIKSGTMDFSIDNNEFAAKAGDFIIILPNSVTSMKTSDTQTGCAFYSTVFNAEYDISTTDLEKRISAYPYLLANCCNTIPDFPQIEKIFLSLIDSYNNNNISSTISDFFHLFDKLQANSNEMINVSVNVHYARLIKEYIDITFFHKLTLANIASHVSISPGYALKVFKQVEKETIFSYLNKVRIKKAMNLIKDTPMSLQKISKAVGFESQQYFTRVFLKITKITPSKYANYARKGAQSNIDKDYTIDIPEEFSTIDRL